MECPLCNGLNKVRITCSFCGRMMEDQGRISDYLDDYSAYEEISFPAIDSRRCCRHLLRCPNCRRERHYLSYLS